MYCLLKAKNFFLDYMTRPYAPILVSTDLIASVLSNKKMTISITKSIFYSRKGFVIYIVSHNVLFSLLVMLKKLLLMMPKHRKLTRKNAYFIQIPVLNYNDDVSPDTHIHIRCVPQPRLRHKFCHIYCCVWYIVQEEPENYNLRIFIWRINNFGWKDLISR